MLDLNGNWTEELGAGHPALKADGTLRRRAKELILAPPLPSRTASVPNVEILYAVHNPVRNTELFLRIADHVELFPESYNQEVWGDDLDDAQPHIPACGTAFCIAGHAGHETGWHPRAVKNHLDENKVDMDYAAVDHPQVTHGWMSASAVGRLELGLTNNESGVLFDEDWRPAEGMTVPEALRELAFGATVMDVSSGNFEYDECYEPHLLVTEYEHRGTILTTGERS